MLKNLKIGTKLALSMGVAMFFAILFILLIGAGAYRSSLLTNSEIAMQKELDSIAQQINQSNLETMLEMLNDFKPYETSNLYLVSRLGTFVAATRDPEQFKTKNLSDFPEYERIFSEDYTSRREADVLGVIGESWIAKWISPKRESAVRVAKHPADGQDYFFVLSPIETGEWTLIMEVQRREILAPMNEVLFRTGVIAGLFFLALIAAVGFISDQNIARPIGHIIDVFDQIGMGNYEARAEVTSEDELGTMAASLNAMLDSLLPLVQTREERDAMQASIFKLVDEVGGVAEGDLTTEAEVTTDVTGPIATAFNSMTVRLREIVRGVQEVTLQLSSSANEIQTTAEHLVQGSEAQATQIADTSSAIEEMAVSIQQVSETTTLSATVGEQATANAQQGAQAVQVTIESMNRIRDQVQETAKRIKRLGESSQEIGDIVQLIRGIAKRTSILALNASLEAAMAGEAGRGFAVVAEDVKRLAERSTEATKQIETLIRMIQNETNEAVAAMEAATQEVVEGSELADQAGQALAEIENVSNRLAELIQSISMAAEQQARGSETLAASMGEISEVTQQTAAGTKQAAVSISSLALLADELYGSVSTFKLPGGNGRGD